MTLPYFKCTNKCDRDSLRKNKAKTRKHIVLLDDIKQYHKKLCKEIEKLPKDQRKHYKIPIQKCRKVSGKYTQKFSKSIKKAHSNYLKTKQKCYDEKCKNLNKYWNS